MGGRGSTWRTKPLLPTVQPRDNSLIKPNDTIIYWAFLFFKCS